MVLNFVGLCTKCGELRTGKLHFDDVMKLIDTDGGMLFNDGWHCHLCLGQPWSSADFTINL